MFIAKYSVIPLLVFYISILIIVSMFGIGGYYLGLTIYFTLVMIILGSGVCIYKFVDDYLDNIVVDDEGLKYTIWNGLFSTDSKTVGFEDIASVNIKRGVGGLLFNFGTLNILLKGQGQILFENLDNIVALKEFIEEKMVQDKE